MYILYTFATLRVFDICVFRHTRNSEKIKFKIKLCNLFQIQDQSRLNII